MKVNIATISVVRFIASCSVLLFLCASACCQNYFITPVPANFVRDGNTTFLVDLTSPKTNADYAVGSPALTVNPNYFIPGIGYTNTLGFSTSGNWPTNAWTVEMIVDVPYSMTTNDPITLGGFENDAVGFMFDMHLELGFGVRSKMYSWNPFLFMAQPHAGANGASVQAQATDKPVYLAFGCDFSNQLYMVSAREVSGALLNSNVSFTPMAEIDNNNSWPKVQSLFTRSMPATFTLGNSLVQIKALRISNKYRPELFTVVPLPPQAATNIWLPTQLDAARTTNRTTVRTVGYGPYNYITAPVNESFVVLTNGSAPITIQLTNVPVGLYSFYVWGQVAPNGRTNLDQVWQPCPMDFTARDSGGHLLASGRMLLKQGLAPRRMQGFHFHLDTQTTNVTLTFQVTSNAVETAWIQQITEVNQLAVSPMVPIKAGQYLATGPSNQLTSLTAARQQRDDQIWNVLPPLNTQLEVEGEVTEFELPPPSVASDGWVTMGFTNVPLYYISQYAFVPLDFINTNTGVIFRQSDILSTKPWPSAHPDDGTGTFYNKTNYPTLTASIYNTQRAELLGFRYQLYFGSVVNSRGSLYGPMNALNYFNTGDPNIGQDAALALVRIAYDWPALEMSLQEIRLCLMSPDMDYAVDWSSEYNRNGKMEYTGWSGFQSQWLMEAYDQLFPYIQNNQILASEVHRYIPWVNTPQDVINLLDNYIIFPTVRDVNKGIIDPTDNVPGYAGLVLGPSQYTAPWFDLTHLYTVTYPTAGGTYQEMYASALPRSGTEYIGSFMTYGLGMAEATLQQATLIQWAKTNGVSVPMDLTDLNKYPKVRSAANYMLDMWVAGGFPFMVGDASGGPHTGILATNMLGAASQYLQQAFNLDSDPRIAWLLAKDFGYTNNAAIVAAAAGQSDPILTASNRVVPDWGAILEMEPSETNVLKKTSATLRLGIGAGHSHSDFLDLNLFAMGLPVSVDLACRNESTFWSRPAGSWSFMHNHALGHNTNDPSSAGAQSGEPWLRAFSPPLVSASYTDSVENVQLDRDVIMMQVGTNETFYAFDVQRVTGGTYHTWAFHGCESTNLQLNVPMTSQTGLPVTNRWIDRTLEGTQYTGNSANLLQATWTMTRSSNSYAYSFNGGGTLQTVSCEQTVLGTNYNAALPPVNVRATLLGRGNDLVLQGNGYSSTYQYNFPFLWVQSTNEATSVYPAVYEWYRGSTPVIASAVLTRTNPLQVVVTTTTGQTDTFDFTPSYNLAVSRDASGVRWVKLSGSAPVTLPDLSLAPAANYDVTIASIDYVNRRLTTSGPLPPNSGVMAGNGGRRIFLKLQGSGTTYTWQDDLLVQEGAITSSHVTTLNSIQLNSDQSLLFDDQGNRNSAAMTVSTEDGLWNFRNGQVIKSPPGASLTTDVFTDANGDGFVDMKTYEIGIGDHLIIPVDLTIQRSSTGWIVNNNSAVAATVNGTALTISSTGGTQALGVTGQPIGQTTGTNNVQPHPPQNLRLMQIVPIN